jgi:Mg2+/citrate symporter
MQDNMKKLFLTVIPLIIVGLGLLLTILLLLGLQERSKQDDTYLRFEVCSLNVPPTGKTQADIDRCWTRVEKSTGVTVDHFSE